MSIYDYIKEKEGFRSSAYDDAVGVKTIGYGRTGGSFEDTTREAEDAWLKRRVDSDRNYVEDYANKHGYDWSDQQKDALASFVFNLGRGRLDQLTGGGKRSDETIGQKIRLYNKAGGNTLPGLVTRRNEEAAMFSGNPGGVPQSTFQPPHSDVPRPQPEPPRVLEGPSFNEAFAAARKQQGAGGEFEWQGNFYNTNLKEEEGMRGYRRGSTKVLDEEEMKRREAARLAGANNTSGGRNKPRGPLNTDIDPLAEITSGAQAGYKSLPTAADAMAGAAYRANQPIQHPNASPMAQPINVPAMQTPPVVHPDASPQGQQTGVMNAAQKEAHWRQVWQASNGFDRNAKAAWEAARAERMAIEAAGQGSAKDANPGLPTPGVRQVASEVVEGGGANFAPTTQPENQYQGMTMDQLMNLELQTQPGSINGSAVRAEIARRQDEFGSKIDQDATDFLTPLDAQYEDRIMRDMERFDERGGITSVESAAEATKLDDQAKQFTLDAEITKGQAIQTEANMLANDINSKQSEIEELEAALDATDDPVRKGQISQVIENKQRELAPVVNAHNDLRADIEVQKETIGGLDQPSQVPEDAPTLEERTDEVVSTEVNPNALDVPQIPGLGTPEVDTSSATQGVQHPSESSKGQVTPTKEEVEKLGNKVTSSDGGTAELTGNGNVSVDDGKGNKGIFSSDQAKKVGGILKEYLGLEAQDLKRAVGMYLMSRVAGGSHATAMSFAGQQVLGAADERKAAETAHIGKLIKDGKYTTESIAAYKKSKDPADLIDKEAAAGWKELGNTQTLFGPGGNEVQAREVETADGSKYWVDKNDQPINLNTYHTDPSRVKNTDAYKAAVREEAKQYTTLLDQFREELDTFSTKDGDKHYTKLISGQAGFNVAQFARDNNIPAEGMGQLLRNSYDSAIKYSKTTKGKQAENIIPFLNEQYIKSEVGDPSLFELKGGKTADADKVIDLMDRMSRHLNLTGSRIDKSTEIIQVERKEWLALSEEDRKRYIRSAGPGQSGFMNYLESELQADV